MLEQAKKWTTRLARPDILFYCLPWLMILLIAGTIAQRDLGLYNAQHLFFSSWILWVGAVPLPGGCLTLSVIFINLCMKFIFKSTWSRHKSGTILTHFGILLLFCGAIITAATSQEGFIIIPEGQIENNTQDYHERGLFISRGDDILARYSLNDLKKKPDLKIQDSDIYLKVTEFCRNCEFQSTQNDIDATNNRRGLAEKITLHPTPVVAEDEANMAGITFQIYGAGAALDGTYISTEAAPHVTQINDYNIQLRRVTRPLPFSIKLNDFVRELHPGTMMAKSYHSDVEIIDGTATWPVRIGMNDPLRYKGYTLFQSSFADTPAGEATILAVVKNDGWLFPYIASIIIALGLILHLYIRLRGKYA